MTETEWLAAKDPEAMLTYLDGVGKRPRDRKLRLFATACVRQVWPLLNDERSKAAVEVAERFADGQADEKELAAAWDAAWAAAWDAAWAAAWAAAWDAARAAAWDAARAAQCALIRELVGDPFHPVKLDTSLGRVRQPETTWFDHRLITPTVLAIAQECYESRRFGELPILADALEDAGVHVDERVLAHLRAPGVHVRGCWAVDLILGKE